MEGLEQVDCLLCGSARWSTVLEAADVHGVEPPTRFCVVRCQDCGLSFTNPRPDAQSIGRFYTDDYEPHQGCGLTPRHRRRARWQSWMPGWWRARNPVSRGLSWHGQGRLLDFGCGNGAFLELMHRQGWHVMGIDSCADLSARIESQLGLRVLIGSLPHPELRAEQFDVVTMWHSLEHVHRPLAVLQHVHELLTPGGTLMIGVPNFAGGPARWFGPAWFCLDLPRHLTHFTPVTLRRMVEAAGFRVERLRMQGNRAWLRKSAALACQQGMRGGRWLQNRPLSALAEAYLKWTRQSDSLLVTASKPCSARVS